MDGKIYEGDHSAGAEIGHMVLVVDGEPCTCGRKGCWESYSSLRALIRMTEEAICENPDTRMREWVDRREKINGKTAFEASRQGDRAACLVVDAYTRYLSEGILNMVNIFRPEVVLIGGGISNEGEYLLEPVRAVVEKYAYGGYRTPVPPIRRAALGNDAGIIGAAMLAACL